MSRIQFSILTRALLYCVALCGPFSGALAAAPEGSIVGASYDPKAFLQQYCLDCHGEKKQKGDRRFDHLDLDFGDEDTAFEWQEILDLINLGEMPPEDEEQPTGKEVGQIVSWITPKLDEYYALEVEQEKTGLRRLNTVQYRNTLRDLLGINMASFDPVSSFPSEERKDGFENIASKLVTSRYLMERYLEAASLSIDKIVGTPARLQKTSERFTADDFRRRGPEYRAKTTYTVNVGGKFVDVGHSGRQGLRIAPQGFEGVPASGYYTITVKAEGVGRRNRYDPSLYKMDFEEPIKLALVANDPTITRAVLPNETSREIEVIALEDNDPQVYTVRVWLDEGFDFGLYYENGPVDHRNTLLKVHERYHPETRTSNWRDEFSNRPSEKLDAYLSDVYEGPRLRVHWAKIEGPEAEVWPPQNYRALFGARKGGDAHELIASFTSKAFRRPALKSEIERYTAFYDGERSKGLDRVEALANTYKGILCSPYFLYIETPLADSLDALEEIGAKELEAYALASRLSYFLWSSMPDKELLEAAASGSILKPGEVTRQARRMLLDPRAEALVAGFTDGWLGLHKLGQVMPDPVKFANYNSDNLEKSMREETRAFFRYILAGNRKTEEFLNADYSFVDRRLAKHYQLPYENLGDRHQKVTFAPGSLRGGLLGQAGIHTVTANGVDTSPVVRGIWILENILGTPPSPPPPDVPALEPDIRGATSIREQLAKHREIATCNECHRKMDPLGFAMESFDAIGGFREYYQTGKPSKRIAVDTSGKLPSGDSFKNVDELKDILVERKDQFAHCLTEKLMMYALGREVSFADRPQIDAMVEELQRRGGGLRDLVMILVESDAFRAL